MRVVNVENYQCEENDIILMSLIRSNVSEQIGLLKTSNRVCVAMSRSKHGLKIFGKYQCWLEEQHVCRSDVSSSGAEAFIYDIIYN